MTGSSNDPGTRPAVQAAYFFKEMAYGADLGDYIMAARGQRGLERLGWLVRRMEPKDRGGDSPDASASIAAEAATADDDVEDDAVLPPAVTDRLPGLDEVCRLVGATPVVGLLEAIEAGLLPVPDDDVDDEDVEEDDALLPTATDGLISLDEVCRLVGLTMFEVDEAIEAGRFPLPDGYVSARPYWERETIGWWVERGGNLK
jgi:hypothetical protein